MSDEPKRRRAGKNSWYTIGELITDREELAKLSARIPPDDGGPQRVLLAVVDVMMEREGCGKQTDLVRSIAGLTELLTAEQTSDLLRLLAERQVAPVTPG